jgi:6-phosphogluconolactonase
MTLTTANQPPGQLSHALRYQTRAQFVRGVADATARALRDTLDRQATATLAVPGGRTMADIIPTLAAELLHWNRVTVALVDERWVPQSHPDSNEAAIRATFKKAHPSVAIAGLYVAELAPEDRVRDLSAHGPPDIVLLSMASDGHIGSVFPGDPSNQAAASFAVVHRSDHVRVTMTPKHLCAARTIILAIDSNEKERVLSIALKTGADLPVRHVLRANTQVHIAPSEA